jgi:hypothetical protein
VELYLAVVSPSRCRDQPVAEIVPDTQPAIRRARFSWFSERKFGAEPYGVNLRASGTSGASHSLANVRLH